MAEDLSQKILVAVTTYKRSRERALILGKALRHFRFRNQIPYRVLLVSDGHLNSSPLIDEHVDYIFSRRGPSGLQEGELQSIRVALDFAVAHGFEYMLKMCGDIICNTPEWIAHFFHMMRAKDKVFLSTHCFADDSWIFGTKLFLARCELLHRVYPGSIRESCLETQLTKSLSEAYDLRGLAYMINSWSGEGQESRNEFRDTNCHHAHKIYRFKDLDVGRPLVVRAFNRFVLYPGFRLWYNLGYLNPWR